MLRKTTIAYYPIVLRNALARCVGTVQRYYALSVGSIKTFYTNYQSLIYSPTDAPVSCLKQTVLKFILKQLRHVSVHFTPSSGRTLICAY